MTLYDWITERVTGPRVLDIGCGTGHLAARRPELEWTGIERDATVAGAAQVHCASVIVGAAEDDATIAALDGHYDTIVFCDALEHFVDPADLLRRYVGALAPSGRIITAIPNIAHVSMRADLLRGRWTYTDTGILDRTHLRFFTYDTAQALLRDAGLDVTETGESRLLPRVVRPVSRLIGPNLASTHLLAVAQRRQ